VFNQEDSNCLVKKRVLVITTKKKVIEYHHFIVNVLGQVNGALVIRAKVLEKLVAIKEAEISDGDMPLTETLNPDLVCDVD